ncbi:MAG: hypothetical protein KF916_07095 [Microbacteriaceae bacterium]|nr:hypothetical protein [Microbacteriaceae bacterium]
MVFLADYQTFTQARENLKSVLDAAGKGRTVTIARDGEVSAVLSANKLREYLATTIRANVQIYFEEDVCIAIMEGTPFVSEGKDLEEALNDLVLSLREYAEDWEDHLHLSPNHKTNWGLVNLVKTSSNEELLDWFASER